MKSQRLLSYLLISGGVCLLFLGARDLLESHVGQIEAAGNFRQVAESPIPRTSAPGIPQRGDAVAKIVFPRFDKQLYVFEGDGPSELRRGPGHLAGTAMPGDRGNCVIAGHRDTHFRLLKDVHKGDDIVLSTSRGEFHYRVTNTRVVLPQNTSALKATTGSELNLITCYPFYYVGAAPQRFVVRAELTQPGMQAAAVQAAAAVPPARPAKPIAHRAKRSVRAKRQIAALQPHEAVPEPQPEAVPAAPAARAGGWSRLGSLLPWRKHRHRDTAEIH